MARQQRGRVGGTVGGEIRGLMPVHLVAGNLFANRFNADALAHGVNCMGVMDAGIAVEFRRRSPLMFAEYRDRCLVKTHPHRLVPGGVFLWRSAMRESVFNLATQSHPGPCATYDAFSTCMATMRKMADEYGISTIAMPRIGAGLGGLDWERVLALVEAAFDGWGGELYVYDRFEDEA